MNRRESSEKGKIFLALLVHPTVAYFWGICWAEIFSFTMQWSPVRMLLQFAVQGTVGMWAFWTVSEWHFLFQQHSLSPHRHKNNTESVLQLCCYISSCRRCDWDIFILRLVTSLKNMKSSLLSPQHKKAKLSILENCSLLVFLVCKWINALTATTELLNSSIFCISTYHPSAALFCAGLEIQESQLQLTLQLWRTKHL